MNEQSLTEAALQSVLDQLPAAERYLVAYSGGLDSSVLLFLLTRVAKARKNTIRALHVNHGLNANADKWIEHCRSVCKQMAVELDVLTVDARNTNKQSPEEAARSARYTAFSDYLRSDDILFTGHHRDDQAETFLLQLVRGAGTKGLSAMPFVKPLGQGLLTRPLLGFSQDAIRKVAVKEKLDWIEDDSNQDKSFDRNFIRADVLPLLKQRWPAVSVLLSRAASHQAEASQNLKDLAVEDLIRMTGLPKDQLDGRLLRTLSTARAANLLRYWLNENNLKPPSKTILERILTEMLNARPDASPSVCWEGAEVRRYQEHLYAMPPLPEHDNQSRYHWNIDQPLTLDCGVVSGSSVMGEGIAKRLLMDRTLEVRFRQGGECIRPVGRAHHNELKKLFQEAAVPPWLRDRIPLLYQKDSLVAVVGYWIDDVCHAQADEEGLQVHFEPYC